MLRFIEYEDITVGAHGRDQVGLLWHIPRFVYFALVNHFLLDVEATFGAAAVAPDFFFLFVVAARVLFGDRVGELDLCDLEVVGVITRGVGADEETVGGIVFARVAGSSLVVVSGVGGGLTSVCRETIG